MKFQWYCTKTRNSRTTVDGFRLKKLDFILRKLYWNAAANIYVAAGLKRVGESQMSGLFEMWQENNIKGAEIISKKVKTANLTQLRGHILYYKIGGNPIKQVKGISF